MHKSAGAIFFAVLAAVFFLPFLGGVHLFDWDEINFAEIAREMIVLGNYLEPHINFESFTEKPPMFMWLQALSMTIFGVGEYASRLPNAIMGIIVLPVIYNIGKTVYDNKFGYFWALAYFGSILPHLYFKSGIIDPIFNFFIFSSLYFLIRYYWAKKDFWGISRSRKPNFYLNFGALFAGIAILTKGPVAFLIIGLVVFVYTLTNGFRLPAKMGALVRFGMLTFGVVAIWFGINFIQNGTSFLEEFIIRQWELFSSQDAGHGGFPGYHFVVLLLGCFPASIFALQGMTKNNMGNQVQKDFKRWMIILFWVILILFTVVKTKIVHYSSLAYYPLTFLAALSLYNIVEGKWSFKGWMRFSLIVIGLIVSAVTLVLPFLGMKIHRLKPLFQNDQFALENLNAVVNWTGVEALSGLIMFFIVFVAVIGFNAKRKVLMFNTLFFGTAIWVFTTLVLYISKIESYSQRAAIEFWEEHAEEDAYLTTYGYKSYADLFYGQVMPKENANYQNKEWLFKGRIDKPVYISCKVTSASELEAKVKGIRFIGQKNGFYFYLRKPK
jgi:4-amino-4-deoxy-L-arabinose transferase-like glycosyltransferase